MNSQESFDRDAADFHEASETPDMAELIDSKLPDELQYLVDSALDKERGAIVAMTTVRLITEILQHGDKELTALAISAAAGLSAIGGKSMSNIAREKGISVQALSKRVVEVSKSLGLSPSRRMRSEKSRRNYQQSQTIKSNEKKQCAEGGNRNFFTRFGQAHKCA